jgi:hypothetical protein
MMPERSLPIRGLIGQQRHGDGHFTLGGKLDGIADKIVENLAQASRVPSQSGRHILMGMRGQFQSLPSRLFVVK